MDEIRRLQDRLVKANRETLTLLQECSTRDMTGEEEARYRALDAEVVRLQERIEQLQRAERMRDALERVEERQSQPEPAGGRSPDSAAVHPLTTPEYRSAWRKVVLQGSSALTPAEVRAVQNTDQTLGGYLTPPLQFVEELIEAVRDQVWIRAASRVMTVSGADSLGAPYLAARPSDAEWTSELSTGSEDTALRFGRRDLRPHPLAKRIRVSKTLINRAALNPETIVLQQIAYIYAITEEKAFMAGSGANQPLGVFTASADGISTARDVSTGNTTTEITVDGLIAAKYALKSQYWPRATWYFHRTTLGAIRRLKDDDGQYLWQPSVQAGQPDQILGIPVRVSEYVPSTAGAGLYVGILGDFQAGYWIADSMQMEMQRLVELYAESNEVGWIFRRETDGMPVLEEAFVRIQHAS